MIDKLIINTYTSINSKKLFLSPYITVNYNSHSSEVLLLNYLFGQSIKLVVQKDAVVDFLTLLKQGTDEHFLKQFLSENRINVSVEELLFTCIIE